MISDNELLEKIDYLRKTMRSVATGGEAIDDVNDRFMETHRDVVVALGERGIFDSLPYSDLWDWYERWSSGDLPTYQSRRVFVSEVFSALVKQVTTCEISEFEPTGFAKLDRTVGELRNRLFLATTEEQFQAVGLLCREALISLAQAVYDPDRHPILDLESASPNDAKRMLEAYVAVELSGSGNEEARKHVRSAADLANKLQHRRTAAFRLAALCVEATTSVINLVAILDGRRDP